MDLAVSNKDRTGPCRVATARSRRILVFSCPPQPAPRDECSDVGPSSAGLKVASRRLNAARQQRVLSCLALISGSAVVGIALVGAVKSYERVRRWRTSKI